MRKGKKNKDILELVVLKDIIYKLLKQSNYYLINTIKFIEKSSKFCILEFLFLHNYTEF